MENGRMKLGWREALLGFSSVALIVVIVLLIAAYADSGATWSPPLIAGIIGAVVGGSATVAAQIVAAKFQADRFEQEWRRSDAEAGRASSLAASQALLDELVALRTDFQTQKPTLVEALRGEVWLKAHWSDLWSPQRKNRLDGLAAVITDAEARTAVLSLLEAVNSLPEITDETFPGRLARNPAYLSVTISGSLIGMVATYLRREPFASESEEAVAELAAYRDQYEAWVESEYERSVAAHDEAQAEREAKDARRHDSPTQ